MMTHSSKWQERFLDLADHVASWSKDPSTKVGAVIVSPDKRILSVGFNGFPPALIDADIRLMTREIKLDYTVHAEVNALMFCQNSSGAIIYVSSPPCSSCVNLLLTAGIKEVHAYLNPELSKRWNIEATESKLNEALIPFRWHERTK